MRTFMRPWASTPYRWRGQTRNGADSPGFTAAVYREQHPPIVIPRLASDQHEVGIPVELSDLRYGDLVFFDKYGDGRITHVGLYVGNGLFAHATCGRGVVTSRLDEPYYQARYRGAKRLASGS